MDNFGVDTRHNLKHLRVYPMERGNGDNLPAANET